MSAVSAPMVRGSLLPRALAVPLLAAGPLVVLWGLYQAVAAGMLLAVNLPAAVVMLAVFWSPLPFSAPALLLQDARDDAAPGVTGPVRALVLLPWLCCAPASRVRPETWASLVGFTLAVAAAAHALHG